MHYILGGNKVAPAAKKDTGAAAASNGGRPATASGGGRPSTNTLPKRGADTSKLEAEISKLEQNNGILDREREFYFNKLQQVEQALKNSGLEQSSIGEGLLAILYASD